jgi:hypothetical protein
MRLSGPQLRGGLDDRGVFLELEQKRRQLSLQMRSSTDMCREHGKAQGGMLPAQQMAKRRIKMDKKKLQDKAEQNRSDLNKALTETAEMQAWSQLTFTCPKCGSDKLLKCLGGQVVYAQVDEIHYKREECEEDDKGGAEAQFDGQNAVVGEDVEDAYVVVQSRPDGTELWDFGVDDASDHSSWFRCAECAYELAFEDGTPVETDTELAQCLIRFSKKSREAAIDAEAVGKE